MKIRTLVASLVASAVAAASLGAIATPAGADHLAPNVCVFAETVELDPGPSPTPPSTPPGTYDFDSIAIVCVGADMPIIGGVNSEGSYPGTGYFEGSFDVDPGAECDGSVEGTRLVGVVVGNVETAHCGDGPLVATFIPIDLDVYPNNLSVYITRALVVGAIVLLP